MRKGLVVTIVLFVVACMSAIAVASAVVAYDHGRTRGVNDERLRLRERTERRHKRMAEQDLGPRVVPPEDAVVRGSNIWPGSDPDDIWAEFVKRHEDE